jgi:hypothetical protein
MLRPIPLDIASLAPVCYNRCLLMNQVLHLKQLATMRGGKLVCEWGVGSGEQGFRKRGAGISYPNFSDFLLL